jgi:hypothetical protein
MRHVNAERGSALEHRFQIRSIVYCKVRPDFRSLAEQFVTTAARVLKQSPALIGIAGSALDHFGQLMDSLLHVRGGVLKSHY